MSRIKHLLCTSLFTLILLPSLNGVELKGAPAKAIAAKPAPEAKKAQPQAPAKNDAMTPAERKMAMKKAATEQIAKDVPVLLNENGQLKQQPK